MAPVHHSQSDFFKRTEPESLVDLAVTHEEEGGKQNEEGNKEAKTEGVQINSHAPTAPP